MPTIMAILETMQELPLQMNFYFYRLCIRKYILEDS